MSQRFFQLHLDFDPTDAAARLLFAEFVEDRGDPLSDGYCWLVKRGVQPQDYTSTRTWDWNDDHHFNNLVGAIPHSIFAALEDGRLSASKSYREYPSREAAERAFARALLADVRRKQLGDL